MKPQEEIIILNATTLRNLRKRCETLKSRGFALIREWESPAGKWAKAEMRRPVRAGWYWTVWETDRGILRIQEVRDTGHPFDAERREKGLYFGTRRQAQDGLREMKQAMKEASEKGRLERGGRKKQGNPRGPRPQE